MRLPGEGPRDLGLNELGSGGAFLDAVEHELVDLHRDPPRHVQAPISDSISGFSSFRYSLRAARARCRIVTGSSASAAR